ncbi:TRAP transporter small permease [bacterium]|nr:TRAP transporter small permease [bacterium]
MRKVTQTVSWILAKMLIVLMAVIVLDVTWQVFTRLVLKNPSSFTEELAGFLLIWIGVLGAAYALHTRAHLGIDILSHRLQGVGRDMLDAAVHIIVLLFALAVMVAGGMRLVLLTLKLNQISPALGIKMGYVYTVLPLSGLLMMLFSLDAVIQAVRHRAAAAPDRRISGLD